MNAAIRNWISAGLLGLATVLVLAAAPARIPAAETYVKTLADQGTAILRDKSLDNSSRYQSFRMLILDNTDLDRIAGFALGRYAKDMRASNRFEEYRGLFREYVVRIYASRLGQGSDQKLSILRSAPAPNDEVLVYTQINPLKSGDSPIKVNWRLAKNAGTFKILDVQVADAWMAIEQRDTFTSVIANNRGDPVKLIDYLKQQLAASPPGGNPT